MAATIGQLKLLRFVRIIFNNEPPKKEGDHAEKK